MFTKEKYCAVCGCLFSLPLIRNPENPDPNEDEMLAVSDPYPLFKNVSTVPDFFVSPPAKWQYRYTLDPAVPTTESKDENISVYESTDAENGMLFPIHQACLDLVHQMCEIRKGQGQVNDPKQPRTLEEFCDCLELRRSANLSDSWKIMEDQYYGNSGGIELAHKYFGARQFWTDEWDTSRGWELLCADPASMKISDLSSFILSELPQQSNSSQTPAAHQSEAEVEWLFPQELKEIQRLDQGGHDWAEGIRLLKEKANSISADEGGEPQEEKLMSSVPLGLKNRWRIWKVLEHILEE
ncbi:MAG: hypothetical protein ASARMPRED_002896 [Alectoria sarmentosa]|nr:MAG: hypothetical protein ASARMPRED_002896 [Alectoria sarmentosa]